MSVCSIYVQMLHDRGYLVTDGELRATREEFRERFGDDPRRDDMTLLKHKRHDPSDEVFASYAT